MSDVIGALLEYFAVSVPGGEEGRGPILIWTVALIVTVVAAGEFIVWRLG